MQHLEFFDIDHFEERYYRIPPPAGLEQFIDFFWETKFSHLWEKYPTVFSDAQFPNIGYTYIINLGTPFTMQVGDKQFRMKTDGFLPRYNAIECFHQPGNHMFGIKFRVSPVMLEKKIDFSEYRGYIFPLSYLLSESLIDSVKKAASFTERITMLSGYFFSLLNSYNRSLHPVTVVSEILEDCFQQNRFSVTINELSAQYRLSARTLQRYFDQCTGISSKQALQVMRIRKATAQLANAPSDFNFRLYGYYDYSHFFKHLKYFLKQSTLKNIKLHLKLLEALHR